MSKIFWDGRLKIRQAVIDNILNYNFATNRTVETRQTNHRYKKFHDIFHDGWVEYFPAKRQFEVFTVEDRPYLKESATTHATSEVRSFFV